MCKQQNLAILKMGHDKFGNQSPICHIQTIDDIVHNQKFVVFSWNLRKNNYLKKNARNITSSFASL